MLPSLVLTTLLALAGPCYAANSEFELVMHKRRRLLAHLREADFEAYARCVRRLGLADVFGRVVRALPHWRSDSTRSGTPCHTAH